MSSILTTPQYGASSHYLAERGDDYFAMQDPGAIAGWVEAFKFQRFLKPDDRVLDFGAGTGTLLSVLTAGEKLAVDVNPASRQHVTEQLGIASFADLGAVPECRVDAVVSNHCLEHVPYPIQALQEIRRVLVPGGQLLLVVPIDDWRTQLRYDSSDRNHHLQTWTPLSLGHTLAEAGFEVDQIGIVTHALPPHYAWWYRVLPFPVFQFVCRCWSVLRRRRQIFARAIKPAVTVHLAN